MMVLQVKGESWAWCQNLAKTTADVATHHYGQDVSKGWILSEKANSSSILTCEQDYVNHPRFAKIGFEMVFKEN